MGENDVQLPAGRRLTLLGLAAGLLASCVTAARGQIGSAVNLVVTYSASYVLSPEARGPEARVTVGLYVEPPGEGRAALVTEKSLDGPGQVPITVSLSYDPGNIDARARYTVMAHIDDRGRRRFESHQGLPVITRDSPSTVTLILGPH
jgi:uncharacterized lipoprotein YbaY